MKWIMKWIYDDEHNDDILVVVHNPKHDINFDRDFLVVYYYDDEDTMINDWWSEEEIGSYSTRAPSSLDMQRQIKFAFESDDYFMDEL